MNELIDPHGVQVYDLKWKSSSNSEILKRVSMKLSQTISLRLVAGFFIPGGKIVITAYILVLAMYSMGKETL